MSEAIENVQTVPTDILKQLQELYNKNPALRELNKVEGFNPLDFIRIIETDNHEQQVYMDVKNRKLWFRSKYPTGKIAKVTRELMPDHATFEARIYADKDDAPENFLANSYATRYFDPEDKVFGNKFVELAEVAAVGRALADAGFNIQGGAVTKDDMDPHIVDAGVAVNIETGEVVKTKPASLSSTSAVKESASAKPVAAKTEILATSVASTPEQPSIELSSTMDVETLKKRLTVDSASKVIITEGFPSYRNKTMGWLAMEKPNALNYFKDKAQDNLIKAAAQFLLEAAQPVA